MKRGCCKTKKNRIIWLGSCGGLFVVVGSCIVAIYYAIMKTQITIREGNMMWPEFLEPSVDIYTGIFFFNVTNAEEFQSQTNDKYVAPVFEQLGPYVYREDWTKDRVEFQDTSPEEISFRQRRMMFFDAERSSGREDDVITTMSLVTVGIPTLLHYTYTQPAGENITNIQKKAIDQAINSFYEKNDLDLLFQHTDPIVDKLVDIVNQVANLSIVPIDYFKIGALTFANSSFGWPDCSVYTGTDDTDLINVITEFNGQREMTHWFGERCNQINGTDGTTQPPFMNKNDIQYIFSDEVMMTMPARYVEDVQIKKIPSWKYWIYEDYLDSIDNNPENICYCPDQSLEFCHHDGARSIMSAVNGVPLFVSWPNMLFADEFYTSKVKGMNPDKDEHFPQVTYEPTIGACTSVDLRIQLNYFMTPYGNIKLLNKVNETLIFPILWLNTSYVISDELSNLIYSLLVVPTQLFPILQIVFCIFGGISLLVAVYLWYDYEQNTFHVAKSTNEKKHRNRELSNVSEIVGPDKDDSFDTNKKYQQNKAKDAPRVRYTSTSSTANLLM